jgi:hypothetical protein
MIPAMAVARRRGERSEFVRTGRGEYMLRDVYEQSRLPTSSAEPTAKELEDEVEAEAEELTGIIQAFGMYWTRSLWRRRNHQQRDALRSRHRPAALGAQLSVAFAPFEMTPYRIEPA